MQILKGQPLRSLASKQQAVRRQDEVIWMMILQLDSSEIAVKIHFYFINASEIPGELSRENMIPAHMKITCYFHT